MLLTTPAALGAAGGHPGLASGEPVLFAGEVQLGRGGELVAWTLVSGTYQISDDLMYQSSLPRELYWRFVTEDEVGLHDVTGARVLRGGHLLLPPMLDGTQGCATPPAKAARTQSIEDLWEPAVYAEFIAKGTAMLIDADIVEEPPSLLRLLMSSLAGMATSSACMMR
jgi:hypothetical protein